MIKITKEEAAIFRQKMPDAHIAIVNRHHKNKGYYIVETGGTMAMLKRIRNEKAGIPVEPKKHSNWKKKSGGKNKR